MGIEGREGDSLSNQKAVASRHFRLRLTKAAERLVYKQLSTQAETNASGGAGCLGAERRSHIWVL